MKKSRYSSVQKELQESLRQARVDAGLRQVDLAKLLDKPQSFVSKYESGEKLLDLLELRQVCVALNVSLSTFVEKFEDQINEA